MLKYSALLMVVALAIVVSACENTKTAVGMTLDESGNPVVTMTAFDSRNTCG